MNNNAIMLIFLSIWALGCQKDNTDPYKAVEDYYSKLKISTDVVNINGTDSTNLKMLFLNRGEILGRNKRKNIVRPPDIVPMLEKKLFQGSKEIQFEINSIANKRGAVAACVDGQPKIYLPKIKNKRLSPFALVFFRFHEYAHHRLGHAACSGFRNLTSNDEIQADCFAAELLEHEFGHDGEVIVHHIYSTFLTLNDAADGHYPSSETRGEFLYSGTSCNQRLK